MNKYGILNQGKLESGHAGKKWTQLLNVCFTKIIIPFSINHTLECKMFIGIHVQFHNLR